MKKNWMLGLLSGALVAGCGLTREVHDDSDGQTHATAHDDDADDDDDGEEDGDEVEVALDQVPAAIKKAAEAAVPGFVLSEAEQETEEGALHWCLEGEANGEAVEVELDENGKVLEIERGEEDDD